jgi:hypothetical protein
MSRYLPKTWSKIALISIIYLSFPVSLWGFSREGEELKILDDLIATSERQITLQKELKDLIIEFHNQQDLFYQGSDKDQRTKELASKMVDTAMMILKTSEDNHYLHLFPPFFVEELKLFAHIGKKKTSRMQP